MTREAATPATPIVDSIAPPVAHTERPRDPGRRRLGLAIAGGGLVLAGTGLAFGWSARGAWDEAFAGGDCVRTTNVCNAHGQELADKARSRGLTSTLLVGTGVAALAAGIVVFVTAPRRPASQTALLPTISNDGVGLALTGSL